MQMKDNCSQKKTTSQAVGRFCGGPGELCGGSGEVCGGPGEVWGGPGEVWGAAAESQTGGIPIHSFLM